MLLYVYTNGREIKYNKNPTSTQKYPSYIQIIMWIWTWKIIQDRYFVNTYVSSMFSF